MIRTGIAACVGACGLLLLPFALQGQIAERFYGGVHAHGATLTLRGGDTSSSFEPGLGFRVGYLVTPAISAELKVSGTVLRPALANPGRFDHSLLTQTELLGRYQFPELGGVWTPSVHAGVSWLVEHPRIPNSLRTSGSPFSSVGISLGSGVSYQITSSAAVDGAVTFSGASFAGDDCPPTTAGGTACPASARLDLGITWYRSR